MRIAILSDIHANTIALDAVLADIATRGGVDGYWLPGDFVALGYDPNGVLARITALENCVAIRGNADRYALTGVYPPPSIEDARNNPSLIPILAEVHRSFAWTMGMVTAGGWLSWLDALPLEQRLTLPDGSRVLLVHASPGKDDGHGVHHGRSDAQLAADFAGCEADLVCVGHTHEVQDRQIADVHIVNPGSVSNPLVYADEPDTRATYALLDATEAGYTIAYHYVAYDHDAVIAAIRASRHAAGDYLIKFQRGEITYTHPRLS